MTDSAIKRDFSKAISHTNKVFLNVKSSQQKRVTVGFILQKHFSMVAFTGAVDVLVTANLVLPEQRFDYMTLGIDSRMATSDLGIDIATGGTLDSLLIQHRHEIDILIVCGGLRCSLEPNPKLSTCLKAVDKLGITLGSLWNGVIPLAHAGLLEHQACAVHPDNHAYMREQFPQTKVSDNTLVISDRRVSSAGPVSALEMMFKLIAEQQGQDIVRAVREILSCDQVAENQQSIPLQIGDNPTFPEPLRNIMLLMRNNIEEPLSLEELSDCINISRRQIERLFQTHLETSPSRYYLELRITHARRLLLQSNDSITNVSLASGFVSTSHFSNCFKDYFGISPSAARLKQTR